MDYQRLQKLSSAPGSPVLGTIYFDTTRDTASEAPFGVYTTAGWEYFGSGGGGGGTVDSVVAGTDIGVDDTDPANPVVSFTGTIPTAETSDPIVDGTASPGTATVWSRGDHVHPTDTSRMAATETLHAQAAANANDGDIAVNSHKITGLSNGSASSDAAAFGQIPTAIDGHLTLGGKPVAATVPTSGGPYYLKWDGTEWSAQTAPSGPTDIDTLTLAGKTISSTPASAAGQVFAWNGTAWVPESLATVIGGSPAEGDKLVCDGSGNPYWVDDTNDALQVGFVGITNPGVVSGAISSSPDITFTNWPTSDEVWLVNGSRPGRYICPAPGTQALSGVTSGDWAYVYAYLVPPAAPGGTPTVSLHVGTSRSTAALAAADQVANASGVIVWDGVVKNTGGTYSLTGGTPASGSTIPSAGRDRRLWAQGYYCYQSGDSTSAGPTTSSTTPVPVLSSLMTQRVECSGKPMRFSITGSAYTSAQTLYFELFEDGAVVTGSAQSAYDQTTASIFPGRPWEFEFTPTAGSHLFVPYWYVTGGTAFLYSSTVAFQYGFRVEEILRPNANNGTA